MTVANAVGNGVADDKLIYTYMPDIRYYLAEEPILENVESYRLMTRRSSTGSSATPKASC